MPHPTLAELSRRLAAGTVTSRQLIEASLATIADPSGEGARTFISVDAEGARAAADHLDFLRRRGRAPSAFAGIPVSVKDLFDLAGEVTTAGSRVLRDAAPADADAPAIARLKAKGFVVVGRTNMTEFAYSGVGLNPHYGTPRSPHDRATGRIPGGSSSGAGVSVADGMAGLAIGTDTNGSCRIPAAYCGIVGYRPSAGRIPTAGAFPLSPSFDAVGPLANSVACCAAADAIMAGEADGIVAERPIASLRLAVVRDFVLDGLEPQVAAAFDRALAVLGRAGAALADLHMPELADLPKINARGGIVGAEAYRRHRPLLAERGGEYDPRVGGRLAGAQALSAAELLDCLDRRRAMIARFAELVQGFDAVLLPTTLNTAPPLAALSRDEDYFRYNAMSLRNTAVGSFLNACAISLPMHRPGEAPAGLMLMAPWGRDRSLFAVAGAVEAPVAGRG